MTLADIRPLLLVALIALAALSTLRSNHHKSGREPARIPVRFEKERKPRRIEVR